MTIKLIYHDLNSISGGISPFDETICEITRGRDILLACPYLSISYLYQLIAQCKTLRVITDVEEWIASHGPNSRQETQDFIKEHLEHIHHYKDLHAKVIVSKEHALLGSANFTEKGLTRRIEVSVLFERETQVEELRQWFDSIWSQTSPVDVSEMEEYVASLPIMQAEMPRSVISSEAPKVRAKLASTCKNQVKSFSKQNQEGHIRLIERIRLAPNREWINEYFDLVKELISFTGLTSNDPRLVLSIPSYKKLPVTINYRYVLRAAFFSRKPSTTGFIFGASFTGFHDLQAKAANVGRFEPLPGEEFDDTPYFIRFSGLPNSIFNNALTNELKEEWMEAVLSEMSRCRSSPFRKFHEPVLYEAAVNLDYRKLVVDEVFSNKHAG
jgi:hypothetical protein